MYPIDLTGKTAVVFGVANHRSIAWDIAKILDQAGAEVIIGYQNERVFNSVESLSKTLNQPSTLVECDASEDSKIENAMHKIGDASKSGTIDIIVHSIAFADKDDLGGPFVDVSKNGFITALTISAYSLIPIVRYGSKYMPDGGSIISMTYQANLIEHSCSVPNRFHLNPSMLWQWALMPIRLNGISKPNGLLMTKIGSASWQKPLSPMASHWALDTE